MSISQDHALIAHVDIETGAVDLVYVDLAAGRWAGDLVVQAKRWEGRTDVFSVAELPEVPPAASGDSSTPPAAVASSPEPVPAPAPVTRTTIHIDDTKARAAIAEVLAEARADRSPAAEQDTVRSRPTPDEGDPVTDVAALQRHWDALPADQRAWISDMKRHAQQAGVPFHMTGTPSRRRWELNRALIKLAENGRPDDDVVRALLEPVIGDVAHFANVTVGHLVGSLSATEATTFGHLVNGLTAGDKGLAVDDGGRMHVTEVAA